MYVYNVTSTSVSLHWKSVPYVPSHGEDVPLRYVAEIIDIAGGLRGSRTVINERAIHFKDLVPGTQYTLKIHVS